MRLLKLTVSKAACAVLLMAAHTVSANSPVFLEQDGVVVIDAESAKVAGEWPAATNAGGYIGNTYLSWAGIQGASILQAPHITYRFRITQAGNYQMNWLSYRPGFNKGSTVRFPTGKNIDGESKLVGWTHVRSTQAGVSWSTIPEISGQNIGVRQYFSEGDHTMIIVGRYPNHRIQRFVLYRYQDMEFNRTRFETVTQSPQVYSLADQRHEQAANTCDVNTYSLAATHDAHLVSGSSGLTLTDGNAQLIVANTGRYAYVNFDMPDLPANVSTVDLEFFTSSRDHRRTLNLYHTSGFATHQPTGIATHTRTANAHIHSGSR